MPFPDPTSPQPVQPPDMVGAGIMQPQAPQSSVVDALRSGGNLPSEIMGMLVPPTTPGQAYASAAAGGVAAMRGQPNPVAQMQQAQQQQQMQQAQMMERMQERRQQMAMKKETMLLPLYESLIKSDSPEGRVVGARGIEMILKSQGQPPPSGFAESFGSKLPSLDKRKEAYMSILAAQPDPILQAGLDKYLVKSLNIPPDMLPMLKQEATSDMVHKLFFGKTKQQEAMEIQKADRDQKRVEQGDRRQDAIEARQAATEAHQTKQEAAAQQRLVIAEGHLRIAQHRSDQSDKRLAYMLAHGPEEKRLKALDHADLFANQMDAAATKLEADGYLPARGMSKLDPRYGLVVGKRALAPFDSEWQLWSKHLKADMVGYSRTTQGDIGPRTLAAFSGALQIMDAPPDIESIRDIIRNMRLAIKLGREGKDVASFVYVKKTTGETLRVPWTRGMKYGPGDIVVKVE